MELTWQSYLPKREVGIRSVNDIQINPFRLGEVEEIGINRLSNKETHGMRK